MAKRAAIILALLSLATSSLWSGDFISNGDFSEAAANGLPSAWSFAISHGAKASAELVKGGGPNGLNAMRFSNSSSKEPNVFATFAQRAEIPPDVECELSFSIKAKGSAGMLFTYGKTWSDRRYFSGIAANWETRSCKFTPKKEEFDPDGKLVLHFITEDLCEELLLADVKLKALNTLSQESPEKLFIARKAASFNPAAKAIPDGLQTIAIPSSQLQFSQKGTPSREDLSCEAALEYDDEGLIFHFAVRDDKHCEFAGESLWQGDSIQVRIDPEGALGEEGSSDIELGVGLLDGKPQNWCWTSSRELRPDEMDYGVLKTQDGYIANLRVKWSFLKGFDKSKGALSFNFAVNDNDGSGRKVAFLANGLHNFKSSKFNCLCLLEGKEAFVNATEGERLENLAGKRVFVAPGVGKSGLSLVAKDSAGRSVSQALGAASGLPLSAGASAPLSLNVSKLAPGTLKLELLSGIGSLWSASIVKSDLAVEARQSLASAKTRYAAACKSLDDIKCSRWRVAAIRTIMDRQIALLEAEFSLKVSPEESAYYAKRGLRIVAEMNDICSALESELSKAKASEPELPAFRFVSTERKLSGGYFEGVMRDDSGKESARPIVFTGYGHFGQAVKELPSMPSLQANVIQIEIGPRILTGRREDGSFIVDKQTLAWLEDCMKSAEASDSTICLLLSPHYFPDWALKAHPEVVDDSGFLKYKFEHPYARGFIEGYLKILIPFLKNSKYAKSIHSLCLSNEPTFQAKLSDPFYRALFLKWLSAKYGSIAAFDNACGTSFKSFEAAIPSGREMGRDDGPLYYEFVSWRMETLASWHRWMASIVKEAWPEIPVHAKIMMAENFVQEPFTRNATDPELFAQFCDLNGNDDYFSADAMSPASWLPLTMGYALQASLKPVHIVNSENHIIRDRFEDPVPYSNVYTAMFQQFLHGCGGSAVWVWENSNYKYFLEKHDFVGSIYRRPEAILAVTDASADANRIAPEIREIFNARPQAALLYSPASNIMDSGYGSYASNAFAALACNGVKTGFLSEKQAQAGNFGALKILFLTRASHVEPATLKALGEFAKRGGTLVSFGESLSKDQHGKTLSPSLKPLPLDGSLRGLALAQATGRVLNSVLGERPVGLDFKGQSGQQFVEWQAVKASDGSWLLNAVNYGNEPLKVSLVAPAGAKAFDIVHLKDQAPDFSLAPKAPLVLKIRI